MERAFTGATEFFEELENIQFTSNDQIVPTGQRQCPICKNVMTVQTMHGITLDVCLNHGVWLDSGELKTLIARAQSAKRQ